ncbi:hypothetical protein Tco_1485906 [Tanacetum coccineum]
MDWYTKNALWIYWMRGDDEITLSNKEDLYLKDENNNYDHGIAEVFKIETNLFDYETLLCAKFNEFNYLLKVDPELFTHDIQRTETYENKLNNEIDEPWSEDGVPYEMYGFCKRGKLPGMVRVSYMTYFQDYEWYDELVDRNLKEEALKQKAIYEKSWGDASQSVIIFYAWDHIRGPYANFITTYDPYLDINSIFGMNDNASSMSNVMEEQRNKRCNLFDNTARDAPVCEIKRFEMIKYSFGQDEEYVAIKECEYDELTRTNEDACRTYQNIFKKIDEGWTVTRTMK